ncbi:hypothetical protein [Mesorhizobium sp. CN2-181]|uniref:hypothetical protein n=1 Tax=Mesorhizobium yinganensis TaxID=3157707 RepID=UPI0032B8749F
MLTIKYAVFILSCSVSNPDNCSKEYVGDVVTPTPIGCIMGGQPFLRQWIGDHVGADGKPARTFKSLRCVDSRRKDFEMGRDQA